MKRVIFILGMVACFCGIASAGLYVETFDTDNAGWSAPRINNDGSTTLPGATWSSTGGNPDGHISSTVGISEPRLYGLQPPDDYGDMTGLALTVDYKIDGTVTGPSGAMVRFYIGTYTGGSDYYVTKDAFSWAPNDDTSWTTHQVALMIGSFEQWPNQVAGKKTFAKIVAAPEDIGLVFADNFTSNSTLGFSSTDGATIHVDNFGLVPVPVPAAVLLGMLGLGAAGLKLRKLA